MPAPKAYFTFLASLSDLSFQFTDRSGGVITRYLWDFGFKDTQGNKVTSEEQNPNITFPSLGNFTVSLKVENSDGSDIKSLDILVTQVPSPNLSIYEMAAIDLPKGIGLDLLEFNSLVRKWQVYLQNALSIPDADLFNEAKWPPISNILIGKLIIHDIIVKAAVSTVTSLTNIGGSGSSFSSVIAALETISYQLNYNIPQFFIDNEGASIIINSFLINGEENKPFNISFNTASDLLTFINNKGIGNFFYSDDGKLKIENTQKVLTAFNLILNPGAIANNLNFEVIQRQIASVNGIIETHAQGGMQKGPVKKLETGPTNAEWYDGSVFWMNLFKGQNGNNFMSFLESDICLYANRLKVRFHFCKKPRRTILFTIGKS